MANRDVKGTQTYGSDVAADTLRAMGVPYLTINPGASFRGLHDSIVNHLGNSEPEMLLTLHEAQAVAIAHGYAKITGEPMGVILHANVGLMNAVMAIYDAYVDRMPMLILGATGAVDANRRRPWIEWIHTSRDQAALVRQFVKWDDQPVSPPAMVESLLRAWSMTKAAPQAPTYVCLDVCLQEDEAIHPGIPNADRFPAVTPPSLGEADLDAAKTLIEKAQKPVVLVGRNQRSQAAWDARIKFAEATGGAVICDQKVGVGFPSAHPNFVSAPAQYPDKRTAQFIRDADLIISLDWPDVKGLLSLREDKGENLTTIIASPDEQLHNGWSLDHFPYPEANLRLPVTPDKFVEQMLPKLDTAKILKWDISDPVLPNVPTTGQVTIPALMAAVERARGDRDICYTRLTFGAPDAMIRFTGPLDSIGYDGGGGIGSTPGITVGAALALAGTGRIPVSVIGDGDLLMGSQALWTATTKKLPCLFVVNNNSSFYNDVEHQETVAKRRGRPVENKYIGMEISDPLCNLPELAHSYGARVFDTIDRIEDLDETLEKAFDAAANGEVVLVDVTTLPPAPRG